MGGSMMKIVFDGQPANNSQEQIANFVRQAFEVR